MIMNHDMTQTPAFPDKKYDIIYADPPWEYTQQLRNPDRKPETISKASRHYQTLSVSNLEKMPIKTIASSDCLLFLWVGSPVLDVGINIGKAWGFDYITVGFVWDKDEINPGNYTMSQVELCLIFKKGKIPQPRGSRNEHQLLKVKRGFHSVKPFQVKERIDRMFPAQSKIELFARPLPLLANQDDGWDYWGNEV